MLVLMRPVPYLGSSQIVGQVRFGSTHLCHSVDLALLAYLIPGRQFWAPVLDPSPYIFVCLELAAERVWLIHFGAN